MITINHLLVPESETLQVREFQLRLGHLTTEYPSHLTKRKLRERLECMREELAEFEAAIETQDLPELADALIDLVYFAKGTACMLGIWRVWPALWQEVQRANLEKQLGMGKRGHVMDATKPEGWVPPRIKEILEAAGYDHSLWTSDEEIIIMGVNCGHNQVDEALCVDDEAHS